MPPSCYVYKRSRNANAQSIKMQITATKVQETARAIMQKRCKSLYMPKNAKRRDAKVAATNGQSKTQNLSPQIEQRMKLCHPLANK